MKEYVYKVISAYAISVLHSAKRDEVVVLLGDEVGSYVEVVLDKNEREDLIRQLSVTVDRSALQEKDADV